MIKTLDGVTKNLKTIKDHSRLWVRNQVLNTHAPVFTAETFDYFVNPALLKPESRYDFSKLDETVKLLDSQLTNLENKYKATSDGNLLSEYTLIKNAQNLASDTTVFKSSTKNILGSIAMSAGTHKDLKTFVHNIELKSLPENVHLNYERQFRKSSRPAQSSFAKMIPTEQVSHLSSKYDESDYSIPCSIIYHCPYLPTRLDVTLGNHLLHPDYKKQVTELPIKIKKSMRNLLNTFNCRYLIYSSSCISPIFHYDLITSLASSLPDHRILVDKQFDTSMKEVFKNDFNFHLDSKYGSFIYPTLDKNFGPFFLIRLKILPG